ncbi:hypothetical protein B0H21DRAFT_711759 [Amylocystis lapponica]|nr:hypothetical protein B0H21DRAFT_711759 [Amylocystis lapponica]
MYCSRRQYQPRPDGHPSLDPSPALESRRLEALALRRDRERERERPRSSSAAGMMGVGVFDLRIPGRDGAEAPARPEAPPGDGTSVLHPSSHLPTIRHRRQLCLTALPSPAVAALAPTHHHTVHIVIVVIQLVNFLVLIIMPSSSAGCRCSSIRTDFLRGGAVEREGLWARRCFCTRRATGPPGFRGPSSRRGTLAVVAARPRPIFRGISALPDLASGYIELNCAPYEYNNTKKKRVHIHLCPIIVRNQDYNNIVKINTTHNFFRKFSKYHKRQYHLINAVNPLLNLGLGRRGTVGLWTAAGRTAAVVEVVAAAMAVDMFGRQDGAEDEPDHVALPGINLAKPPLRLRKPLGKLAEAAIWLALPGQKEVTHSWSGIGDSIRRLHLHSYNSVHITKRVPKIIFYHNREDDSRIARRPHPARPKCLLEERGSTCAGFHQAQEEGYRMVMGETQSEADEEDEDAAPVVKVDKGKQRQANPALPAPQHDAEVVSSSPRPRPRRAAAIAASAAITSSSPPPAPVVALPTLSTSLTCRPLWEALPTPLTLMDHGWSYDPIDIDAIMGGPADPIDVDDILGGPADPIDVDDILGGPAHPINTDAVWRESAGDIDIDIDDDMGISDALADTLEPSEGMSARTTWDTQAADSPELDEDVQQVVGPSFPALQQMEAETIRLTATMTRLDEMSRVNRQNMAALDALLNMYTSK